MKFYHPLQRATTSWQAQLGLNYTEYPPLPQLTPYIAYVWALTGTIPGGQTYTYRILPDGCLDIVLNLEHPLLGSLSGAFTHFTDLQLTGSVAFIGLCFCPGGFTSLTSISCELVSSDFLLAEAIGLPLDKHLWQFQSIRQALAQLQQAIWGHFSSCQITNLQKNQLIPALLAQPPAQRVSDLSTALGYSDRQFRRLIRQLTGYAPKPLLRIMRFQQTLKTLVNSPATSTLDLALSHGYYDQSHLLHEFEELGGISPQELQELGCP